MLNKHKILYLEHEKERNMIAKNLEKNLEVKVTLLPPEEDKFNKNNYIQQIKAALAKDNFDLVLTDAYFLAKNKKHPEHGDGTNCIKEIVETVQQIYPSSKIVVYTHYRDNLFENCKGLDIYDIWNKASTPPHYLKWRVERTLKEPWNIIPGQVLVNTIKKYLVPKQKDTWETHLLEMLENYSPQLTAHQNIDAMATELRNISKNLDLPTTIFKDMTNSFLKQDIMSLISNPKAWGHAKHVLNVYWLGYYILNSKILDKREKANKIVDFLRLSEKEKKESRKLINRSWIVASLFHDFGLIGEKLDALIKNTNKILKEYPWSNDKKLQVNLYASHEKNERKELLTEHLEKLKGNAGGKFALKIKQAWTDNLDHGILSAITLLDKYRNTEEKSITCAAVACALHNIKFDEKKRLKYTEQPLACLLRFCDEIQTWERETGLETFKDKIWLQSIALAEISEPDEDSLYFRIEYIPRKDLSPSDSKNRSTYKALQDVLDRYTIPSLNALDWTDSGIKLAVDFKFRGEPIGDWSTS